MLIYKIINRLFKTDLKRRTLRDVTAEDILSLGASAVAIDADNTSSYDGTTEPLPYSCDWIREMEGAGIPVILLSNAKNVRARALADKYGIPVVGLALKPLPFGYIRAAAKLKLPCKKICLIGDQLFTDILGANLSGCRSIYVYPYKPEERNVDSYRRRRANEKKIFSYLEKNDKA